MPQVTLRKYFVPIQPALQPKSIPIQQPPVTAQILYAEPGPNKQTVEEKQQQQQQQQQQRQQQRNDEEVILAQDQIIVKSILDTLKPELSTSSSSNIFFIPPHEPRACIIKVQQSHLPRLKNITSTLLPVRYPDKFFTECLSDKLISSLSRVLLFDSKPVGWIRCRLDPDIDTDASGKHQTPTNTSSPQIYIQALGILAPYRNHGLATCLLDQIVHSDVVAEHGVTSLCCHVWESNHDALAWYEKRGFKRVLLVEQYYRRLKPAGAWIMRLDLD